MGRPKFRRGGSRRWDSFHPHHVRNGTSCKRESAHLEGRTITMKRITPIFAVLTMLGSTTLEAKVLTLTPVEYGAGTATDMPVEQSAALPHGGDEVVGSITPTAEAFLKFDLTPVQEARRPINMVALEWPVQGVFSDSVTTYSCYVVPDSASVPGGGQPPTTGEEDLMGTWNLAPIDIVRAGGATVLFD